MREFLNKILKKFWYEVMNYETFTGQTFADTYSKNMTPEERTWIKKNVGRIQRQCDGYAVEWIG